MMELTINGKVYQFKFGMGFMREINKKITTNVDGTEIKKNIGLQYNIASAIDGELEALCDILLAANKGYSPRLKNEDLDAFIDDENTDIDALFDEVLGFLKNANATKKTYNNLMKAMENQAQAANQ